MKGNADLAVLQTKKAYSQIHQDYAYRNAMPNADVVRMLDKFISLVPGKDVIDIGCAEGRETKFLADRGLHVTGCDLSEEFIEMAKVKCPSNRFFVTDMRHLPSDTGIYDGIWASASFLHIPKGDALATLKGFRNILKVRGLLYLSVLEGNFDSTRPNIDMHWPERHFSDYTQGELTDMLQRVGFAVISVEKVPRGNGNAFLHFFSHTSTSSFSKSTVA